MFAMFGLVPAVQMHSAYAAGAVSLSSNPTSVLDVQTAAAFVCCLLASKSFRTWVRALGHAVLGCFLCTQAPVMTRNGIDFSFLFLGHAALSQGNSAIGNTGSASVQWTAGCIAGWTM